MTTRFDGWGLKRTLGFEKRRSATSVQQADFEAHLIFQQQRVSGLPLDHCVFYFPRQILVGPTLIFYPTCRHILSQRSQENPVADFFFGVDIQLLILNIEPPTKKRETPPDPSLMAAAARLPPSLSASPRPPPASARPLHTSLTQRPAVTGLPRLTPKPTSRVVTVSAVGDVSADGNTYLIAGAIAVAALGTAFPLFFSRKDT